jgi:hypothetical protein
MGYKGSEAATHCHVCHLARGVKNHDNEDARGSGRERISSDQEPAIALQTKPRFQTSEYIRVAFRVRCIQGRLCRTLISRFHAFIATGSLEPRGENPEAPKGGTHHVEHAAFIICGGGNISELVPIAVFDLAAQLSTHLYLKFGRMEGKREILSSAIPQHSSKGRKFQRRGAGLIR